MMPDQDLRVTILGCGNLMEAIFYSLVNKIGQENLSSQVNATTADEADVERKRQVLGIDVILYNNLKALKAMSPDIIFVAPPPMMVRSMVEEELSVYFDWLRANDKPLPEIYAFPPIPSGEFYQRVLGNDVAVVTIFPNNFSFIGGKTVKGEGYYVCAYAGRWSDGSRARLKRIFIDHGEPVELASDQFMPMLGAVCTLYSLWEVVPTISDALTTEGESIDHQLLADYMRSRAQDIHGFRPIDSDLCGQESVRKELCPFLDSFTSAWLVGLMEYFSEIEFPQDQGQTILSRTIDVVLHIIQVEPRDKICHQITVASTRGGITEMALKRFRLSMKPLLMQAIQELPEKHSYEWEATLRQRVKETAHAVLRHGLTLAS